MSTKIAIIGGDKMRQWLINIRKSKGFSQYKVAREANISQSYYAEIEGGYRGNPLNVNIAKSIAKVLDFDWIMFYEEK